MKTDRWILMAPVGVGLVGVMALAFWVRHAPPQPLLLRTPGTDLPPGQTAAPTGSPVLRGTTTAGPGRASAAKGSWPQFRGPDRTGVAPATEKLLRELGQGGPRRLWTVELGEGYAGPMVHEGRVFLMDYDRDKQRDALRCLSLEDGREIWRFSYPIAVKRNHGMSRTVPTLASNLVVAMGPKCHVVCVETETGVMRWGLDLVKEHGTTVPPWYAGQCPLVDGSKVILAPAGPDALLMAVDLATGAVLWKSPNPSSWKMTHSSVAVVEHEGRRIYVYCGSGGVAGVSTEGALLWQTPDWKISIANVPSPIALPDGRLFLSGGYNAGAAVLKLSRTGDTYQVSTELRLKPQVFGATQQTPILFQNHLFGVRPDPEANLVCLNLRGQPVWDSKEVKFGLGPFLIADGLILAVDDSGKLSVVEASTSEYRLLGQYQVLEGREAWAPLALAAGRLLVRDLTRMVCLEVSPHRP